MKNQEKIWDAEYKSHSSKWKKERINLPLILKNKKVLEVGVGNGKNIQSILKQKPSSLIATDTSNAALLACKKSHPNLKLVKDDIRASRFKDNEFDVVLCYYILNNLLEKDRIKAVREIRRILSPKGIILFEDFMKGDFRQESHSQKAVEKSTIIRKSGLIQHFFTKEEIGNLFFSFKKLKLKEKYFSTIFLKPHLKRKIISVSTEK